MLFADKVRKGRELLKMHQQELAKLAGVSRRSVISWEADDTFPRPATLRALAEALQVSVDYLKREDITDPNYGLDKRDYINEARARYGEKAAREMDALLEKQNAFFAGGDISQEAKDAFFEAVMKAYLTCKEEARKTFGRKD